MTNNKQQTTVEWLEIELEKLWVEKYLSPITIKPLLEQAKEMDKERMIGFTNKYINSELWVNCNAIEFDSTVEQYYNETYGNNNE
jgi:hypothetical protein